MLTKFITPKSVIAATVVVSLAGVTAIGAIGTESYLAARETAQSEMQAAKTAAVETERTAAEAITKAASTIATGDALLASSEGKTLDNVARDELKTLLDTARQQLETLTTSSNTIDDRVVTAELTFNEQILWPPSAHETAERLRASIGDLDAPLLATLTKLGEQSEAVAAAQAAWQAEQERIAAEAAAKAAAEAAARRAKAAASSSTLRPSGGSTAPNVQAAPPAAPASQDVAVSFAESFLRQYVSPSQAGLTWNANLCRPGYICGITTVRTGSTPVITLMGSAAAPANYDWSGGKYVLVHEAAHARQYWLYGSVQSMITSSEQLTSSMGITGVAAVEYMADCATIVKIGYAGTYTSSCTPEQLAEAARVW